MRKSAALACCLLCGLAALPASASAEGVAPVEGPWHATTAVGLPVTFLVKQGQVVEFGFRFKWGFCGTYTAGGGSAAIEADGHWKGQDPRGPFIEATFVAPDRAEGVVTAPSRMTPGCPETQASFVAAPGAAPFEQPEAVVLAVVGKHKYADAPRNMVIRRDGSLRFYELHWHGFGKEVARATGRAYVRSHGVVRRPRVSVTLGELIERGDRRVYIFLTYRLRGRVPPGVRHHGERLLEE